ncbi:MAG: FMN-binding negative transcriptional regulator [Candidatus Eremiobacteraeota bacterium]|nr:FMN-binding negative transcriptional regulator [Candidatus Eremiobacteraeota bacterium]
MYIPKAFRVIDNSAALELIEKEPFGTLVSTVEGEIAITHLPFSIVRSEPDLVLCAHMAKANPHWQHLSGAEVVVMFRGVHGYISPRWYSKPQRDVPTWNYAVVNCTGIAEISVDEAKGSIVRRLVDQMEAGESRPWSVEDLDSGYFESQMQGIVAFYVRVRKVDAKFKLSQNRSEVDRDGAIAGLRQGTSEACHALATAMQRFALEDSK